jgi:hypothetical protein
MPDIYIKSFNRPFYLDRCIRSVYKKATGRYRITVIDDGTANQYLEKINRLFPEVVIIKSALHSQKAEAIQNHLFGKKKFSQPVIPVDLWRHSVESGSEYFLMLEDDNWITSSLDIDSIKNLMSDEQIIMLTLDWQGNKQFVRGKKKTLNTQIEETIPDIPISSQLVYLNRYHFKRYLPILKKTRLESLLFRTGIMTDIHSAKWPLYTIYQVTSAFFQKDYWLYLWDGAPDTVNEEHHLHKAGQHFFRHRGRFAKTKTPHAHTSYISSATNNFPEIEFDVFQLNHLLNEKWLSGELDTMENYPGDFSINYIGGILDQQSTDMREKWLLWVERFKTPYRSIGCVVEW